MNIPFHLQVKDPALRPMLRQQALQQLEQANEQLAELQQAAAQAPDTLEVNLTVSDLRFKLAGERHTALARLKMLDEADATRRQRWAAAAEQWLAVAAMWVVVLYGLGGGFLVLTTGGPGAALLHIAKAFAIATGGFWLCRQLLLKLARR